MKLFIAAILSLFVFQTAVARDLEIMVAPTNTFILPLEDIQNCSSDETIKGPIFSISKLLLKWNGKGKFAPVQIDITVTDPNIDTPQHKYSCTIAGNELHAIFGSEFISQGDFKLNACELSCGNLKLRNNDFTAKAVLTVLGVNKQSNGTSRMVKDIASFKLINKAF